MNKLNFKETDIAVIGIGCRLPGDPETPNQLFEQLIKRKDSISSVSEERWSKNYFRYINTSNKGGYLDMNQWKNFDPPFFSMSIQESCILDPQCRLMLKCVYECFENAGIANQFRSSNTSVFIGSNIFEYLNSNLNQESLVSYPPYLPNTISYCFDLRGESTFVNTACSSSLTALQMAYESLVNDKVEMSLAGGVNSIFNVDFLTRINAAGAVSKSGRSHTFESNADGYCRGEGAGVVLLKKLSNAIRDGDKVYSVIRGCSSNNDGGYQDKPNKTTPSAMAQSENLKSLLSKVSIDPSQVFYVECHGTGTPIGDPIECKAISSAICLNDSHHLHNPLYIGSLKPNIGHLEGASGISSLIKVCLMMKFRTLLPMYDFSNPNPSIKFNEWALKVPTEPIPFPNDRAVNIVINNFGIGGTNHAVLISEYTGVDGNSISKCRGGNHDSYEIEKQQEKEYLIPFSANSKVSLKAYQDKLISYVDSVKVQFKFEDFIRFNCNKFNFYSRNVIAASNWDQLKKLNIVSSNDSNILSTSSSKYQTPIVFLFCGQGPQYANMASSLYDSNSVFREAVDHCDSIFQKYYGYSILERLRSLADGDKDNMLNQPIQAQASIFLIHYGLLELFKFWGVKADAILGHSFGDISAIYASGIVSLDEMCRVIYLRSLAQNKTFGMGRMLSVSIGKEDYEKRFSELPYVNEIEIGCYNSIDSIVLVAKEEYLVPIKTELQNQGIFAAFLSSQCPFHSSKQEIIRNDINSIEIKSSNQPTNGALYSTVTSKKWDPSIDKFDSNYSFENIKNPVLFHQTLLNLINDQQLVPNKSVIFIEFAPHPTLSHYLKSLDDQFNITIINPLNKKNPNDLLQFQQSISKIYCSGGMVNFQNQLLDLSSSATTTTTNNSRSNDYSYKWLSDMLPCYQWDEYVCWEEDQVQLQKRTEGPPIDSLGLKQLTNGNIVYQTVIDLRKDIFKYLLDHRVGNQVYYAGTGYVEPILKYYQSKNIKFESLNCLTPFVLVDNQVYYLQLCISKLSNNRDYFQYFKKERDSNNGEWVEVCNGKVSILQQVSQDLGLKLPIDQIKESCNFTRLSKDELYSTIRERMGINYNSFRLVENVYIGNQVSLSIGSTQFKTSIFQDDDQYLSIPVLDSFFHGCLVIDIDKSNKRMVFNNIFNFNIYTNLIPKSRDGIGKDQILYYYSRLIKIQDNLKYYKVQICLFDGTIIMEGTAVFNYFKVIQKITIKNPTSYIYSTIWQLKNSPLSPLPFNKSKLNKPIIKGYEDPIPYYNYVAYKYIDSIKKRAIGTTLTKEIIFNTPMEQLLEKYLQDKNSLQSRRLFTKVMNIIKNYKELLNQGSNGDYELDTLNYLSRYYDIGSLAKVIFSIDGIDLQINQLFKSNNANSTEEEKSNIEKFKLVTDKDINEFFYKKSVINLHDEFCARIKAILTPLLYKRIVIKFIEFGGGTCGLALILLKSIHQLLQDHPMHLLQVHYTFSDISPSFLPDAKKLLDPFSSEIRIVYSAFDLDKSLLAQGLNQSSYDIVLMEFVLHAVKNVEFSLNEIFKILNPGGHLMFYEPSKNDILVDSYFSNFSQWLSYDDNIRNDHCCLNVDEWFKTLMDTGFNSDIQCSKEITDTSPLSFILDAQKPILSINNSSYNNNRYNNSLVAPPYNQVIIFSSKVENEINSNLLDHYHSNSNSVHVIQSLNELIALVNGQYSSSSSSSIGKNLIIYEKGLDQLNESNFEQYSMELTSVLQFIMNNNLSSSYKALLLTLNCQMDSSTINYLNNSLFGVIKYFFVHPDQVKCWSIDLDNESYNSSSKSIWYQIDGLLDESKFIERYFAIRDNQVYIEKVHIENNKTIKTQSYEESDSNLICRFNKSLQYDLVAKPSTIQSGQLEVRVLEVGINPQEVNNQDSINKSYGLEYSGIVTRVSSDCSSIKVNDMVFGFSKNSLSSHIIVNQDQCIVKPNNLTSNQVASIPISYFSSYYGLFKVGKVKSGDIILINSACSSIGLSALNLLKWKNLKLSIVTSVNSNSEKNYLINEYGTRLINGGIYLKKNGVFIYEIKQTLESKYHGRRILVLNTSDGDGGFDNGSLISFGIDRGDGDDLVIDAWSNATTSSIPVSTKTNIIRKLLPYFEKREIQLLTTKSYGIDDFVFLLDEMKYGNHYGKFIVELANGQAIFKNQIEQNKFKFNIVKDNYSIKDQDHLGSTVLITGQRGLALSTCKWISKFSSNVKDIIILSRSKIHWELELLINQCKFNKSKIRYHFKSLDIGKMDQIRKAIDEIYSSTPDISDVESIFHYSFELSDTKTSNVKLENFIISNNAKSHGSIHLHNLSIELKWNLKTFILNSSIHNIFGSEFQIGYLSSNSLVEALTRYRKGTLGLNATLIKWGPLNQSYITNNQDTITNVKIGKNITVQKVLGSLDLAIQSQHLFTELIFTPKNKLKSNINILSNHFDHIMDSGDVSTAGLIMEKLSIKEMVINKICSNLQIENEKLNLNLKLSDYGADSLSMVQFKNWIEEFIPLSLEKLQSLTIVAIINEATSQGSESYKSRSTLIQSHLEFSSK